uniref:TFR_dimer domain-containing protein n=1 Tax=Ascaris lumbricoides TaxID=6252 RepID=A0A0M3I7A5_ASCLU
MVTEVAKRIPNPVVAEVKRGRKTVYDTWIKTFPNEIEFRPDAPKLSIPGAGSDHTAFLNFLGIPVVDFTYNFASTVPTLYQMVTEVAKRIPNPMVAEVKRGRKTVYDTWIKTFPNEIEFRPDAPKLSIPGAGSDHTAFLNFLGIPVVDFTYKNATTYDTYPLYHSLYETPFVNEHIFDTNNFAVHVAVGQYWAELAREFTDSAVLPLNISDLANSLLRIYLPNLKKAMEPLKYRAEEIRDAREQLSRLIKNCQEFLRRAEAFNLVIKQALRNFAINPFDSRRISLVNDRIMGVDRCFINPRGLPRQPSQRHVLFSTSDRDSYTGRVMAAVYDQAPCFRYAAWERRFVYREKGTEITSQAALARLSVRNSIRVLISASLYGSTHLSSQKLIENVSWLDETLQRKSQLYSMQCNVPRIQSRK